MATSWSCVITEARVAQRMSIARAREYEHAEQRNSESESAGVSCF
jgi:hypothetical protein